MIYHILADIVAALHVAWVAFVFFGLILVLIGRALGWQWIRNRWFRSIHLAMIILVIFRAGIWADCPLTTWEYQLREMAGEMDYPGAFIGAFLHEIIHPNLPRWVFPVVYVIFGLMILSSFWVAPVNWRGSRRGSPPDSACATVVSR